MRGVVLAGGKGQRLGEVVRITNKHLLPVYKWPMIYYPLKQLVGVGLSEVFLVSGGEHIGDFCDLLGSGIEHGCNITYMVQEEAGGIAQALGLIGRHCKDATGKGIERLVVILGDNIFQHPIDQMVEQADQHPDWAWLALKRVSDPQRFGVAEIKDGQISRIVEKPPNPISDYAVTGVYVYPPDVFDVIATLKPSNRGELEITDVNNYYLEQGRLGYTELDGYWTDAGTPDSLVLATQLVKDYPPTFRQPYP